MSADKTVTVKLTEWELKRIRERMQEGTQRDDERELYLKIINAWERWERLYG